MRSCRHTVAALPGVIVTQGFIATNARNETVILGRGGSDTSGAYFAAKLQARGPGDLDRRARHVHRQSAHGGRRAPPARAELRRGAGDRVDGWFGAAPALPRRRCAAMALPLRVKDTTHPQLPGTLVTTDAGSDAPRVKAISGRTRVTLVSMETLGMWQEVGFLASAFRCFSDLGLSIDLVSTSESNVTVTLDPGANAIDAHVINALREKLEPLCRVRILENVEVVSLVGQKIRSVLHEIGPAFDVFEELPIHLVSQAASDLNLSFVVEEGQSRRIIQALHQLLVQPLRQDAVFGPTWEELREAVPQTDRGGGTLVGAPASGAHRAGARAWLGLCLRSRQRAGGDRSAAGHRRRRPRALRHEGE